MKVLLLDGYNLIYRARYSFSRGDHSTVYSFFRSLRPLIEKFDPDLTYFAIEGYPEDRHRLLPEYKANRKREDNDNFKAQKDLIISMLKEYFPVVVCRHPLHECDDVIANLVRYRHAEDDCVVVSSDTDFLQLYNTCKNVTVYNPIRKENMDPPGLDYVGWKALKGDSSDNIPGIKGIGDKRASALINDPTRLAEFLQGDPARMDVFSRNCNLIRFTNLQDELDVLEVSPPKCEWGIIKEKFEELQFNSITNEKSWVKFQHTFTKLEKNVVA